MKHPITFLFSVVVLAGPALAAPAWETNIEAAKELASEERKDLFLTFTAPNAWSKKLKEEILDHESFAEEVKDRFVYVALDYPKDKTGVSRAILQQNADLQTAFAVRIFPTIMVCDARARPYAELRNVGNGPEIFLKQLALEGKNRQVRDEGFARAAETEGLERAGHLEAALKVVPLGTLTTIYKKEYDELSKLHSESELVASVSAAETKMELGKTFRDYFVNKDFEGALKAADELIEKKKLQGEVKQQVLMYKLNAYLILERHDEALEIVSAIREESPDSQFAKGAERFARHIKTMQEAKARQEASEGRVAPLPEPESGKKKGASHRLSSEFMLVIADDQDAVEAPPAEKKKESKAPNEAELKRALAKTRAQFHATTKKIDADHELLEESGEKMKVSKARVAELQAALENERVRYKKMADVIERIEAEHNGDHDRAEVLEKELAEREKAWAEFESKQDEITKLEKKAAALRRQAEELRKRAETLRKN